MSFASSSIDIGCDPVPDVDGPLVNMRELAAQLRITRQSLSVWLERWPDFPVKERGTNGKQYHFDVRAVFDFLRAKKVEQAASTADRDQALAQLVFPFDVEGDDLGGAIPGVSVKDQIEAYKLRKIQREEAEASGVLVSAREVSDVLVIALQHLNRTLHTGLRQACRDHNVPEALIRSLDSKMADAQKAFVTEAAALLRKDPAVDVD